MGKVLDALNGDLKVLAGRKAGLDTGTLAAAARTMAEALDSDNSATSKSMCVKQLLDTLDKLEALAPGEPKKDRLDGILDGIR